MSSSNGSPIASIENALAVLQEHGQNLQLGHVFRIIGAIRVRVIAALVTTLVVIVVGAYKLGSDRQSAYISKTEPGWVFRTAEKLMESSGDLLKAKVANNVPAWNSRTEISSAKRNFADARDAAVKASAFKEASIGRIDGFINHLDTESPNIDWLRSEVSHLLDDLRAEASSP